MQRLKKAKEGPMQIPGGRAFQAERLAKEYVWDVCVCPVWQNEREEAAASEAGEE